MKVLVGLNPPIGALVFLCQMYTGRVSDKVLTKMSHVIDCLDTGDDVNADKGFDINSRRLCSEKDDCKCTIVS